MSGKPVGSKLMSRQDAPKLWVSQTWPPPPLKPETVISAVAGSTGEIATEVIEAPALIPALILVKLGNELVELVETHANGPVVASVAVTTYSTAGFDCEIFKSTMLQNASGHPPVRSPLIAVQVGGLPLPRCRRARATPRMTPIRGGCQTKFVGRWTDPG